MQKLYFIDCYNGSPIKDIGICDLRGGKTVSIKFDKKDIATESTDCIYQAQVIVNPDFTYYQTLLTDKNNVYGFRYETDECNVAFVVDDKKVKGNGQMELKLKSMIHLLTESFSYPDQASSSISVNTILNNLDNRFTYTLISPNRNVILNTSIKKDYEILKNIIRYADNWAFRDNGVVTAGDGLWRPQVLIGNFQNDLEAYYNTSPTARKESKPLRITSIREFDNWQDVDQVHAEEVTVNYPTAYPNRIYVFGDNNQGATANSRTELDPRFITQRPDFPLGFKTINNKRYYYITNTNMSQRPIREEIVTYQNSANEQSTTGSQLITSTVSQQQLYQFGCSRIQSYNYLPTIEVSNSIIKKFTLPGNIVYRQIKRSFKQTDGTYITFIDSTQKGLLKEADALDASVIKN